jgi:hypothetical protein
VRALWSAASKTGLQDYAKQAFADLSTHFPMLPCHMVSYHHRAFVPVGSLNKKSCLKLRKLKKTIWNCATAQFAFNHNISVSMRDNITLIKVQRAHKRIFEINVGLMQIETCTPHLEQLVMLWKFE